MNPTAINKIIACIDMNINQIQKDMDKEATDGYKQWLNIALRNGAKIAHAWTRQTPRAPPLPDIINDGVHITDPIEKNCLLYKPMV